MMRRFFFVAESNFNSIEDLLLEWDRTLLELNLVAALEIKSQVLEKVGRTAIKQVDLTEDGFETLVSSLSQDASKLLDNTHLTVDETRSLFSSLSSVDTKIARYMEDVYSKITSKKRIATVISSID